MPYARKFNTMTAEIIKIDPAHPEIAFFRAREVVRSGGVIAYPTETFYGLGADPGNRAAVRRLFEIKGRPADQPILLLIRSTDEVKEWASEITRSAGALMEKFWPGPLTLVFAAKPGVMREITAGRGTIGLRVPGNPLTLRLLEVLGSALTGTSANISGGRSPQTAEETAAAIGGMVDLILDGGRTTGGRSSTVMDVSQDPPRLIREGAVPLNEIFASVRLVPLRT
jgi:L-threonylcarbamoyladenylate synthase